jgi:hypothetical protein
MIPCGTSLIAAGGFDYKNAPNQTVLSRTMAATVSSKEPNYFSHEPLLESEW